MNTVAAMQSWHARLQLEFSRQVDKTVLSKNLHLGPLVVQKPFYPGDGACHVYLLHPPGGLVGGDQLSLQIEAAADTHVLLTTPAANKFYRSAGLPASIKQHIHVHANAHFEWLPQETILYRGSHARMQTRITLEPGARYIGWEILCLGRPAANEAFDAGSCEQRIELWRAQQPMLIERNRFTGVDEVLGAPWGFAQKSVSATMMATPVIEADFNALRAQLTEEFGKLISMTLIDGVMIARYLGQQARYALTVFQNLWRALRPLLLGVPASVPRIWAT